MTLNPLLKIRMTPLKIILKTMMVVVNQKSPTSEKNPTLSLIPMMKTLMVVVHQEILSSEKNQKLLQLIAPMKINPYKLLPTMKTSIVVVNLLQLIAPMKINPYKLLPTMKTSIVVVNQKMKMKIPTPVDHRCSHSSKKGRN